MSTKECGVLSSSGWDNSNIFEVLKCSDVLDAMNYIF